MNFKLYFDKIKKFLSTDIFFLILISVIVFSVYGKSINYEILNFDDNSLISQNINFIADIKKLPKLLITTCYYDNNPNSYYRPVLSLSFAIETLLFGENSKVYHMMNLIFFILSIFFMYVLLNIFKFNKNMLKIILCLLTVHPALTSVSVWIAGRNDSLLTIFSILTLIFMYVYLNKNKIIYLIFTICFFCLSLFTKESAVVMLLIVPIFLYSIDKFSIKKILNIYVGLIFVVVIYLILRKFAGLNNFNDFSLLSINFIALLNKIIFSFIVYINTFFVPKYIPIMLVNYVPNTLDVINSIIFVIFLVVVYYKNFINRKLIVLGLSIFVLYSLPGFFGLNFLFHRLLLPSLGLVIIVTLFFQKIIDVLPVSKKYLMFSFFVLFCVFSNISYLQADKYSNNEIFAINSYNDAPEFHGFVGGVGNLFLDKLDYNKALEFMLLAEKIAPGSHINDIATVLCYQKRFDEAEQFLKKSIEVGKNKEVSYANLSLIYEERQDYKKSLEYAKKAYEENPYNIDMSVNLARKYLLNKMYKESIDIYIELLRLKDNESQYYYSIAFLYDKLGNKEKSLEFIKKAISLDNDNEEYKQFLSEILNSK